MTDVMELTDWIVGQGDLGSVFLKQLLKSLNIVESVEVVRSPDSRTRKSIESGLKDVNDIISGKKKGKTLKQLLNEG